jgi:hypothetical protein
MMTVNQAIAINKRDKELRRVLTGVFSTTPAALYVCLGGQMANYDNEARVMMETYLRSFGYERTEFRPLCWTPIKVAWIRTERWPEDKPWIDGDLSAVLEQSGNWCACEN